MTSEQFISHFPACPLCKHSIDPIEAKTGAFNHYQAACPRSCLALSFNGKFIYFAAEEDYTMNYEIDTNLLVVAQIDFPYEKDVLTDYPFAKMQEKVLFYLPPSKVFSPLGKYFESALQ